MIHRILLAGATRWFGTAAVMAALFVFGIGAALAVSQ